MQAMVDDVRPGDGDLEGLADQRPGVVARDSFAAASAPVGLDLDDLVGLQPDAVVAAMPRLPAAPAPRRLPRRGRLQARWVARRRPRRIRGTLVQAGFQFGDPGVLRRYSGLERCDHSRQDGLRLYALKMLRPRPLGQVSPRERLRCAGEHEMVANRLQAWCRACGWWCWRRLPALLVMRRSPWILCRLYSGTTRLRLSSCF